MISQNLVRKQGIPSWNNLSCLSPYISKSLWYKVLTQENKGYVKDIVHYGVNLNVKNSLIIFYIIFHYCQNKMKIANSIILYKETSITFHLKISSKVLHAQSSLACFYVGFQLGLQQCILSAVVIHTLIQKSSHL